VSDGVEEEITEQGNIVSQKLRSDMEPETLQVEQRILESVGMLTIEGVVDLTTMRPVREAIRELLEAGARHLVLDLRAVPYIDSSGLSVIMTAKRGVVDRGGEIWVVVKPGSTERAYHLTQLNLLVGVAETPEAVLEHLNISSTPAE